MRYTTVSNIEQVHVLPPEGNQVCINSRREIEPLLTKARQVLMNYEKALDCCTAVLDRTGLAIRTPETQNRAQFCGQICDLCKKFGRCSRAFGMNTECPCDKMHAHALNASCQSKESQIYTCDLGLTYWTSPLYRNRLYAGALAAGQVLLSGREEAAKKFRSYSRDRLAAEKFLGMLEEIPVKNPEEIQAMAKLLGACAEEISEEGEKIPEITRIGAGQARNAENQKEESKKSKKSPPSDPDADINYQWEPGKDYPQAYHLEKERILIAAFKRGDTETGGKILKELMNKTIATVPGNIEIIRLRAIELVVLLSRAAAIETGDSEAGDAAVPGDKNGCNAFLEANNRYLQRIMELKSPEELTENLIFIARRMADKLFSFRGLRHASVLRRAERYIWENYTRKISLEEIAKNSGLSAPYFSSIFKEEMGENLSVYLNRLRVERAAALLIETGDPLSSIAHNCGFEDQSWFSKIFRSFTGMSPGKFREQGGRLPLRTDKRHIKNEMYFPEPQARSGEELDEMSS